MSFAAWWLVRHDAATRVLEQQREHRRIQPLMAVAERPVWSDDFDGCTE